MAHLETIFVISSMALLIVFSVALLAVLSAALLLMLSVSSLVVFSVVLSCARRLTALLTISSSMPRELLLGMEGKARIPLREGMVDFTGEGERRSDVNGFTKGDERREDLDGFAGEGDPRRKDEKEIEDGIEDDRGI